MDLRFPRRLRIRRSREYREHRARSRVFRTRSFRAAWAPGLAPEPRLGLVVSRKVGNAVRRNRVKRMVREWFRLHRHELSAPWDVVVIARPAAEANALAEVEAELSELIGYLNRRSARDGSIAEGRA